MLSERKHYDNTKSLVSSRSQVLLPPLVSQHDSSRTAEPYGLKQRERYSGSKNSSGLKSFRFKTEQDISDSMSTEQLDSPATERYRQKVEMTSSGPLSQRNPIRSEYMLNSNNGVTGNDEETIRQKANTLGVYMNSAMQSSISPQLNQTFKRNGARYSLQSIPDSPAKIFVRNLSSKRIDRSIEQMKTQSFPYLSTSISRKSLPMAQRYGLSKTQLQDLEESKKDMEYFNELNVTQQSNDDFVPEDKKNKDLVGDLAVNVFYQHYKNLQKVQQQNKHFEITPSMQTDLLLETERINIAPSTLGLIKPEGDEESLKLNHMHFGDQYASVLSFGLQKAKSIKRFHLQNNRISEKSSAQLVTCFSKQAKQIDLASNCIGQIGCLQLSTLLSDQKSMIEILNLEDNKLGDEAVSQLLRGIYRNKSLRILNLSKNCLTEKICSDMKRILETHDLFELYLHWNLIQAGGGVQIFEGLKSNESLKVIDMSYNTLGKSSTNSVSCAKAIAEYIIENTEMKHMDLSSNQFNRSDSLLIQAALVKNRSIYGFHYTGNVGYVDSRGFLVIGAADEEDLAPFQSKLRIDGLKTVDTQIIRQTREKDLRDCCWICEGWKEISFTWKSGVSGLLASDPMFIHFNFEDFRGNYFGKDNGVEEGFSKVFTYNRVIPPGELEYFFSGEEAFDTAADSKKKFNYEGSVVPVTLIIAKTAVLISCCYDILKNVLQYEGNLVNVELKDLNFLNLHANKQTFSRYDSLFTILPRTRDEVYAPPRLKKKRVKWTFPISLFTKWRPDDEEILKKCFEFDWGYGKIPRLIKREEELNQVKHFFCSNYRMVKDCYKNYATKYPVGDIWAIQNPAFLEFIEKIKIVDRTLIKDPDMNLKWVSTISSIPQADKTNPRNPVQAISRYQMMEVLVRIAEEKYVLKYKSTTNYFEAVKMFWEEHLSTEMSSQYNQQLWRNERYWVEECDLVLKHHKRMIEHVYKKYSKLKVKPGMAPFMSLDELIMICAKAGLNEEAHFGPNVALQAYNFSMMTQIDELQSDRIYQMQIVEFYEALARVAEAASLTPIKGIYNDSEDEEAWPLERRKGMILGHKLEALLARILQTVCDAAFRDKYPPVKLSFFVVDDDSDYELVSP